MAATSKLIVCNAALREIAAASLVNITDANTRQYALNAAWDHAIEFVLALEDWSFARRRATLAGVADVGFPPYTYRLTKPSDYLRKCWIKEAATDEFQIDHAEIAAVFYANTSSGLIEYISDHADNYEPANWPPHFTRVVTLHLASLVAPKLARAGAGEVGMLDGKMTAAMATAREQEALFLINTAIPANRQPVMRRALEFLGQVMSGSVALHNQSDKLRWQMNRSWDHSIKFVLEQGAWNFATRRATLTGGAEPVPGDTISAVIEGYSLPPATETASTSLPDMAGFAYGYLLPAGFLHKIWIKGDAAHVFECDHQFMRDAVYANVEPVVMEYVTWDDDSASPDRWSASFLEVVAAYLALSVAPELQLVEGAKGVRIEMRNKLDMIYRDKLANAKLRDAIQQQPKKLPPGNWSMARRGGHTR